MAVETYDWSIDYGDENPGTTTTFTSTTTETVDVTVSQPDPFGYYRTGRSGFESNTTMGGSNTGYFEMGVNYPNTSATTTTSIDFTSNSLSGANAVTDVSFTLFDIDSTSSASFQDQVTILAYDVNGNPLTVTLTASDPSVVSISGGTATAIPGAGSGPQGSVAASSTEGNVDVFIAGDVSRIEIIYGSGPLAQSNPSNQAIGFGDLSFDLTPVVVCFAEGTLIETETGEVPVEYLSPGDRILTLDSGFQPLRWIGKRTLPGRGPLAPVRFEAGIIGNMAPLLLSPQHRVLLAGWASELIAGHPEVFVSATHLTEVDGIDRKRCDLVTYFHLLFDRHEIVFANGAACESLLLAEQAGRTSGIVPVPSRLPATVDRDMPAARPCVPKHSAKLIGDQLWTRSAA